MKKSDKFEWTPEADVVFAELKTLLSTQLVLAAPISKEPLLLYIAATHQVVSTVLVLEREMDGHKSRFKGRSTTCPLSSLHANHGTRIIKRLHIKQPSPSVWVLVDAHMFNQRLRC